MAHALFDLLSRFFADYGYAAVFFGVMLENAGVPLPGETVLLFGAFLAHQGGMQLRWVVANAMVGATCGGAVGYLLGYYGGPELVRRFRGRAFVSERRFDRAERTFLKHGVWAVFAARFITGLRILVGLLAGAFRMPFGVFFLANAAGALVWAITMGAAGYALGSSWDRLVRFARALDWTALVIALAAIAFVVWRR
ncbi:MAG TPA: DedA family protein, partial [Terriglobia bacterium]